MRGLGRLGRSLAAAMALLSIGCGEGDGDSGGGGGAAAAPKVPAMVTDIDETLTISDEEWTTQLLEDGTYDPIAREGALELVQGYVERCYRVVYLTARPKNIELADTGETAEDATKRWLEEHGYPLAGGVAELVLSPELVLSSDDTTAYKAGALETLEGQGLDFEFAYGNALTDIAAYAAAGIAKDVTYIIGENAGAEGTVAVAGEAWTDHVATVLPEVASLCQD